jgi:hypothetical protein
MYSLRTAQQYLLWNQAARELRVGPPPRNFRRAGSEVHWDAKVRECNSIIISSWVSLQSAKRHKLQRDDHEPLGHVAGHQTVVQNTAGKLFPVLDRLSDPDPWPCLPPRRGVCVYLELRRAGPARPLNVARPKLIPPTVHAQGLEKPRQQCLGLSCSGGANPNNSWCEWSQCMVSALPQG